MLSTAAAPVRTRGASSAIAFTLARFRFTLCPVVGLSLPPYKGATLRGGFGYAFKDLVCIKPDRQCEGCLVQDRCSYFQIFETPVPKGSTMMRKYPFAPHPFVFTPPLTERTDFTKDDELAFELTLIGRAVDYLPYFIYTFDELGRRGIGRAKSKFQLLRVDALSPKCRAVDRASGGDHSAIRNPKSRSPLRPSATRSRPLISPAGSAVKNLPHGARSTTPPPKPSAATSLRFHFVTLNFGLRTSNLVPTPNPMPFLHSAIRNSSGSALSTQDFLC